MSPRNALLLLLLGLVAGAVCQDPTDKLAEIYNTVNVLCQQASDGSPPELAEHR